MGITLLESKETSLFPPDFPKNSSAPAPIVLLNSDTFLRSHITSYFGSTIYGAFYIEDFSNPENQVTIPFSFYSDRYLYLAKPYIDNNYVYIFFLAFISAFGYIPYKCMVLNLSDFTYSIYTVPSNILISGSDHSVQYGMAKDYFYLTCIRNIADNAYLHVEVFNKNFERIHYLDVFLYFEYSPFNYTLITSPYTNYLTIVIPIWDEKLALIAYNHETSTLATKEITFQEIGTIHVTSPYLFPIENNNFCLFLPKYLSVEENNIRSYEFYKYTISGNTLQYVSEIGSFTNNNPAPVNIYAFCVKDLFLFASKDSSLFIFTIMNNSLFYFSIGQSMDFVYPIDSIADDCFIMVYQY